MELMGAIVGLESLKKPCKVTIYSDSEYLVKAFSENWIQGWIEKNWSKVKNVDLWQRLINTMKGHSVRFIAVRGHCGNPLNERCDELATFGYNQEESKLLEDTAYVKKETQIDVKNTITSVKSKWISF